jgi:hypothetical protein
MGAVAVVAVTWAAVVVGGDPRQVPHDEQDAVPRIGQLADENPTPEQEPARSSVEPAIDREVEDQQVQDHGERLEEVVTDLEERHEALVAAGATEAAATVKAQIDRLRALPDR